MLTLRTLQVHTYVFLLKTFTEATVIGKTALPVSLCGGLRTAVRSQTKDLVAKLCQQPVTEAKRRVQGQVKHIVMIPQPPLPA